MGKNFALDSLSWNFTEVRMDANKVISSNLVVVRWLWEIYWHRFINKERRALFDVNLHSQKDVNISTLAHNQIFINDFVAIFLPSVKFRLELLSAIFSSLLSSSIRIIFFGNSLKNMLVWINEIQYYNNGYFKTWIDTVFRLFGHFLIVITVNK